MRDRYGKIFSFLLLLVMLLNYVVQVVPVKGKNHCAGVCQCTDNCGCGCKGKIVFNLTKGVCLDSVGCGCSKGKNIPDFPVKEGLIVVEKILISLYPGEFLNPPQNSVKSLAEVDILHPPEVPSI